MKKHHFGRPACRCYFSDDLPGRGHLLHGEQILLFWEGRVGWYFSVRRIRSARLVVLSVGLRRETVHLLHLVAQKQPLLFLERTLGRRVPHFGNRRAEHLRPEVQTLLLAE